LNIVNIRKIVQVIPMGFPKDIAEKALVKCGRRCCLCREFKGQKMETHHIIPVEKGGDNSFDNCIPLCFECHADVESYNENHPKGRKYTAKELRKHRDTWYSLWENRYPDGPDGKNSGNKQKKKD